MLQSNQPYRRADENNSTSWGAIALGGGAALALGAGAFLGRRHIKNFFTGSRSAGELSTARKAMRDKNAGVEPSTTTASKPGALPSMDELSKMSFEEIVAMGNQNPSLLKDQKFRAVYMAKAGGSKGTVIQG
jgi:hypothetical protein